MLSALYMHCVGLDIFPTFRKLTISIFFFSLKQLQLDSFAYASAFTSKCNFYLFCIFEACSDVMTFQTPPLMSQDRVIFPPVVACKKQS